MYIILAINNSQMIIAFSQIISKPPLRMVFLVLIFLFASKLTKALSVTGRVIDQTDSPIEGLVVKLPNLNLTDTTDQEGYFRLIDDPNTGIYSENKMPEHSIKLLGSRLYFSVNHITRQVKIEMFDLMGRLRAVVFNGEKNPGQYEIDINPLVNCKVIILKVSIGNKTRSFKIFQNLISTGTKTSSDIKRTSAMEQITDSLQIIYSDKIVFTTIINLQEMPVVIPDINLIHFSISGSIQAPLANSAQIRSITDLYPPDNQTPRPIQLPDTTDLSLVGLNFYGNLFLPMYTNMDSCSIYAEILNDKGQCTGISPLNIISTNTVQVTVPSFHPENNIPKVSAGNDTTVSIYDVVTLRGTGISESISEINLLEWSIGGGAFTSNADGDSTYQVPGTPGDVLCIFRVTNDMGNTAIDTLIVHVITDLPTAKLTSPNSVIIDSSYTVSFASSSSGDFGSIALYELSIGTFNDFSLISGKDTVLTAPSTTKSDFPLVLKVTDDDGNTSLDTLYIQIINWWDPGDLNAFDWRDAIIYHILIDRFSDGDGLSDPLPGAAGDNGYGCSAQYEGGDFLGIISKLESGYFETLGMNTLQISPPVDNQDTVGAQNDDHLYAPFLGFWPSPENIDYSSGTPSPTPQLESRFGTASQFTDMINAVHGVTALNGHSMKLIMDYTMNHVSIYSGLYQTKASQWFISGNPVCGVDIWWDSPDLVYCSLTDYLPAFNFDVPEARNWSHDDAVWWANYAEADGLMLDAVNMVTESWLTEMRTKVTSSFPSPAGGCFFIYSNLFTMDETLHLAAYIDPVTKLDGQIDIPNRKRLIETLFTGNMGMKDLANWMDACDTIYGERALMIKTIGTMNTPRAIHYANGELNISSWPSGWTSMYSQPTSSAPYERLELAYAVIFTNPGIPMIYYGDEIGLAGGGAPDNQRMLPGEGSLNPFQQKLKKGLAKLAGIRNQQKSLTRGYRTTLSADNETWVYRMGGLAGAAADIIIAINRSDVLRIATIPEGNYKDLIISGNLSGGDITLMPRSYIILEEQ